MNENDNMWFESESDGNMRDRWGEVHKMQDEGKYRYKYLQNYSPNFSSDTKLKNDFLEEKWTLYIFIVFNIFPKYKIFVENRKLKNIQTLNPCFIFNCLNCLYKSLSNAVYMGNIWFQNRYHSKLQTCNCKDKLFECPWTYSRCVCVSVLPPIR